MSARVRRATMADLDRLVEIEALCFGRADARDSLMAELDRTWATVMVAERGGEVAGFVDVWRVADEVEVLFVATHPEHRRAGLASTLIDVVIASARESGAVAMLLEVRPSNDAAVALYRAKGFEVAATRKGYYDDGEDAWVMRAAL